MNTRTKRSLVTRVLTLQDKARTLFQKKDDVFSQLLAACPPGETIKTERGEFAIHDNFAERNVGYRPASFHRYELKEVKSPKRGSSATSQSNPGDCPAVLDQISLPLSR